MARPGRVVLGAVLALLTVAAASACSSARAQTEEELAAGFTERESSRLTNLYLPDGGSVCSQINIVGSDCQDPSGFPTACCIFTFPAASQPSPPPASSTPLHLSRSRKSGRGIAAGTLRLEAPPRRFKSGTRTIRTQSRATSAAARHRAPTSAAHGPVTSFRPTPSMIRACART